MSDASQPSTNTPGSNASNASNASKTQTYPLRAAIAAALAAGFFSVLGSGFIKCPINALFHFPCPACGSNRAAHALMDLDVHEALRTNPVAPFVIALLVALFGRIAFVEYRDGSLAKLGDGRVGEWIVRWLLRLAWISIAVWILRALGFFGGLPDQ